MTSKKKQKEKKKNTKEKLRFTLFQWTGYKITFVCLKSCINSHSFQHHSSFPQQELQTHLRIKATQGSAQWHTAPGTAACTLPATSTPPALSISATGETALQRCRWEQEGCAGGELPRLPQGWARHWAVLLTRCPPGSAVLTAQGHLWEQQLREVTTVILVIPTVQDYFSLFQAQLSWCCSFYPNALSF